MSSSTEKGNGSFGFFYVILGIMWPLTALGGLARANSNDLTLLSIEDLLDVEVVSVSKSPEKAGQTAAAIYVITQEELRRSGVSTIAEALRMVPGMLVAQIDANKWAISARSFASRFSNKMLVLLDGRSLYTPIHAGVYWDVQDTLLEDIDRIEVIRGPGGTIWGTNAVNGIINIITRPAAETQGGYVEARAGNLDRGEFAARYGGRFAGLDGAYRAYVKYFDRHGFEDGAGHDAADDWQAIRGGFRADVAASARDFFTVQGDAYDGESGRTSEHVALSPPFSETVTGEVPVAGVNLLGRWEHIFADRSDLEMQLYFDHTRREEMTIHELRDTVDFDLHHRFTLGARQEITWGLGYRYSIDDTSGSFFFQISPPRKSEKLYSAFIQDHLSFGDDKLGLTIGTKLEHNDYSGLEILPSARLLYKFSDDQALWAAVTRAVRTPTRGERDSRINVAAFPANGDIVLIRIVGNDDFHAEELTAYELGYRLQPLARLSFDLAAFYYRYDELLGTVAAAEFQEGAPGAQYTVRPVFFANATAAETHGLELFVNWSVLERWRLMAGYSYLYHDQDVDSTARDRRPGFGEDQTPEQQFQLRSYLELPGRCKIDTFLYYVDSFPALAIPAYLRLDLLVGWRPTDALTCTLGFQNLLDDRHQEFADTEGVVASQVPRSIFGKLSWSF